MWNKIKNRIFKFMNGAGSVIDLAPNKEYKIQNKPYERSDCNKIRSDWENIGLDIEKQCGTVKPNSLSSYNGVKQWDPDQNIDDVVYPKNK